MNQRGERKTPRLQDVAELAGVSHQTVSRVINQHPNVSTSTREKVEVAIREIGYRRNAVARSLVTRRSQTIGVLGSELAQFGPANIMLGVERAARDSDYSVSMAALRDKGRQSVLDAATHFLEQSVEGIVAIAPHSATLAALTGIAHDLPIVVAGARGNDAMSGVMVDQFQGAKLAVNHLIQQGHRRIAHIAGPADWIDGAERANGWKAALLSAGLSADLLVEGDWSAHSGYELGRKIAGERNATAVFAGNDQMALGLLRAFNEVHVRVPEDLSIVGFDNQPESEFFPPPLTTIRQDFEELGQKCMNVMLSTINHHTTPGSTLIKPELLIRASTSAPRLTSRSPSLWRTAAASLGPCAP
jgi:DNA-binding LacI/PurR family transcriptional regulator